MSGYLIYVPGAVNCDASVVFPKLGLAPLVENAPPVLGTRVELVAGPDGGQGVVFQHDWPAQPERNSVTGFRPHDQVWTPCKPWREEDGTLRPAGAFWIGHERSRPPTFDGLLRPGLAAAKMVLLKNEDGSDRGRLLVPVPSVLPHDECLDVNDEGMPITKKIIVSEFAEAHARLLRLSGQFLDAHVSYRAQRDQGIDAEPTVNVDLVFRLACAALEVNYLVTPQIIAWLGWFDRSEIAIQVCAGTIDEEAFAREWDAQKKTLIRIAG